MGVEIRVHYDKTWGFFFENRQKLHSRMLLLASNVEIEGTTTSIYMSEEDGFPQFVVFVDDEPVCMTEACNAKQCVQEAKNLYDQYIYELCDGDPMGEEDEEDDTPATESDEEIENERSICYSEDALDQAFGGLLETIAEQDYYQRPDADKISDDIKELVCEYLYRKYNISVYRPMYLEDEDGKEFFVEHPYEHMVFDDHDNPLYKKNK